jgi:hypothetical protein
MLQDNSSSVENYNKSPFYYDGEILQNLMLTGVNNFTPNLLSREMGTNTIEEE